MAVPYPLGTHFESRASTVPPLRRAHRVHDPPVRVEPPTGASRDGKCAARGPPIPPIFLSPSDGGRGRVAPPASSSFGGRPGNANREGIPLGDPHRGAGGRAVRRRRSPRLQPGVRRGHRSHLGGDQTNRLVGGPVSLDAGLVSVDFDALLLDIISVAAAGPGLVDLDGTNGWESVTFSNASFASTQSTSLFAPVGGSYGFGVPVEVTADLVLDPVAPGANVPFNGFEAVSGAGGAIVALEANATDATSRSTASCSAPFRIRSTPSAPQGAGEGGLRFRREQGTGTRTLPGALALLAVAATLLRRRSA